MCTRWAPRRWRRMLSKWRSPRPSKCPTCTSSRLRREGPHPVTGAGQVAVLGGHPWWWCACSAAKPAPRSTAVLVLAFSSLPGLWTHHRPHPRRGAIEPRTRRILRQTCKLCFRRAEQSCAGRAVTGDPCRHCRCQRPCRQRQLPPTPPRAPHPSAGLCWKASAARTSAPRSRSRTTSWMSRRRRRCLAASATASSRAASKSTPPCRAARSKWAAFSSEPQACL